MRLRVALPLALWSPLETVMLERYRLVFRTGSPSCFACRGFCCVHERLHTLFFFQGRSGQLYVLKQFCPTEDFLSFFGSMEADKWNKTIRCHSDSVSFCVIVFYPLTAPAATPLMMCFWQVR